MTEQKFGRYEIKSELGRGGMATVYKAYDPRFEREVAIKVLPREMLHDPQFRVRFEREAKTIAALELQSIVPVYDVGEENGQPYLVMRYMTGGSLADMIGKGPLSLPYTIRIMNALAPALDEAHAKGIVHRDLKPGNILFDRAGEPFISDFGIAKMTQSQEATVTGGAIIGTPAYMSPEQAQGEQVDGRSDVYAMGVIMYEMLSGTQPYQATTPMAVVVKQITEPIPQIRNTNPNLPAGIQKIIEKAMSKSTATRFKTVGEMAQALKAVANGQPAEQAIHNATLPSAQKFSEKTQYVQSGQTQYVQGRTQIGPQPQQIYNQPINAAPAIVPKKGLNITLILMLIVGGFSALCVLSVVAMGIFKVCPPAGPWMMPPWCMENVNTIPTAAPQPSVAVVMVETELPQPTATTAPIPTETLAVPATSEPTPTPEKAPPPVLGGADKVAFIQGNEVWMMNLDGSDLQVLTNDKAPKSNLQWVPGTNTLVYISGTNVNSVEINTGKFDTILSFPFAKMLDEFRLSPDGKQVAISLNREMYVVPFEVDQLKAIRGKDGLIQMKGCLSYTGSTLAAIHLKKFRWGTDTTKAAWLFEGGTSGIAQDLIRLTDISRCDATKLNTLVEIPGSFFTPQGYGSNPKLPDFDWDGRDVFLMNTFDNSNGWGYLYTFTSELHKGSQENPVASSKSRCCYRDARWSPDGSYVFFAFKNRDITDAPMQFYYMPVSQFRNSFDATPIPMPEGFFANIKEAPQPALRSIIK